MTRFGRLLLCTLAATLLTAATGYQVNYGANQNITEWSTCKNVANNSPTGKALFVPTNTSTEWSQFYTHAPAGVTIAACAPPCGGTSYGGFCWYLGATAASCTTTCSSHGGTVDAGTITYAGSGGTLSNCTNVITALGKTFSSSGDVTSAPAGYGCYFSSVIVTTAYHATTPATTQAAAGSSRQRACSCVN